MCHNIKIWRSWSQKWITNLGKSSYWIWFFYHSWNIVYKCGPSLAQFWRYDVTRIVGLLSFRILEKWPNTKFPPEKNVHGSKVRTFHCCLVAIPCLEIAFKNFKKWRQRKSSFHCLLQIFYRNYKILVLSYNLSHYVPIFKRIDEKRVQI